MSVRAVGALALVGWLWAATGWLGWARSATHDIVIEMTPAQVNDVRESRPARVGRYTIVKVPVDKRYARPQGPHQ